MLRPVERKGAGWTLPWTLEAGAGPATPWHPLSFLSSVLRTLDIPGQRPEGTIRPPLCGPVWGPGRRESRSLSLDKMEGWGIGI